MHCVLAIIAAAGPSDMLASSVKIAHTNLRTPTHTNVLCSLDRRADRRDEVPPRRAREANDGPGLGLRRPVGRRDGQVRRRVPDLLGCELHQVPRAVLAVHPRAVPAAVRRCEGGLLGGDGGFVLLDGPRHCPAHHLPHCDGYIEFASYGTRVVLWRSVFRLPTCVDRCANAAPGERVFRWLC